MRHVNMNNSSWNTKDEARGLFQLQELKLPFLSDVTQYTFLFTMTEQLTRFRIQAFFPDVMFVVFYFEYCDMTRESRNSGAKENVYY
jgi:hypothetical protein